MSYKVPNRAITILLFFFGIIMLSSTNAFAIAWGLLCFVIGCLVWPLPDDFDDDDDEDDKLDDDWPTDDPHFWELPY